MLSLQFAVTGVRPNRIHSTHCRPAGGSNRDRCAAACIRVRILLQTRTFLLICTRYVLSSVRSLARKLFATASNYSYKNGHSESHVPGTIAMRELHRQRPRTYSTTGRPRRLTDGQIAEILTWYRSRLTNSEMAERYGIARGTLETIIRTSGAHYKQASPEFRKDSLRMQRTRRARLMAQDLL